jgi:N-methylhydantoinase A
MSFRIGIDIGGAFTDLIAYNDETGEMIWVKDETTPADPSVGVLNTIKKSRLDLSKGRLIIHGQTLAINTVIERKGAKVGLITTKGYRDVLELQRCNRRDMYNFRYKKPTPFVPRYLRLEVDERVMADGTILRPLNEEDVEEAAGRLLAEGVESICISFINSYANPEHEIKAGEIVRRVNNGIPITLGHEITREWREYERTNTAVLNAYVKPKIDRYLGTLEEEIKRLGFNGTFFAMLSNGGMSTFEFARDYPIYTIESGPVAGVIGAITLGEIIGERNIIALDGGSTTTKASLVEDLNPRLHSEYYIERDKFRSGYPVKVPVIDTVEIGNGGTSIAWIDELGNLRVGPVAMGADPGPACYGKGGDKPTVTDAYVVNGLINPNYLLGGEMRIYRDLAMDVIKNVADHYNISVEEAAEGIIKLANENAAYAIRLISVQRGYDPRDFTLIAYGGSGPMFAPFISEELEIRKIVVPAIPPGVFSAWGMLVTDIRHDLIFTNVIRLDREKVVDEINKTFNMLERRLLEIYSEEGLDAEEVIVSRFADMRYYGQEHTVKVPIVSGEIDSSMLPSIIERFHEHHEREYAFRLDSPVEIVNFHVTGLLRVKKLRLNEVVSDGGSLDEAIVEDRRVFLNGESLTLPVIDKVKIPRGIEFEGPAIIEDPTSTILMLGSQVASVDKYGNVVIMRREV